MKSKIKALLLLVCAACALVLIPVFLSKDKPIEVNMSFVRLQDVQKQEQQQQKAAQVTAKKNRVRRILHCQTDEDCIIVDKDPCGCLAGPEGVTAINAEYTLDFDKMHASLMTKACPDGEPSREKECSPDARAVCQENMCKIVY